MTQADLFDGAVPLHTETRMDIGPGAAVLRGFALARVQSLITDIAAVTTQAPFRHLETRSGTMSVAMSNCGVTGWVSDRHGYRYDPVDPLSGRHWPAMPQSFGALAADAAAELGFDGFAPDACLLNRYAPGTRLSLHQDRDEQDDWAPIVSVSLGLPAIFLWGGAERSARTRRIPLSHGDVVVWGGPSRLMFHGVDSLPDGQHPLTGAVRYNLTFRKVFF